MTPNAKITLFLVLSSGETPRPGLVTPETCWNDARRPRPGGQFMSHQLLSPSPAPVTGVRA